MGVEGNGTARFLLFR